MLQFYIKMFNVSPFLLDDALLKCVVTEVVLFSIVAFKTLNWEGPTQLEDKQAQLLIGRK